MISKRFLTLALAITAGIAIATPDAEAQFSRLKNRLKKTGEDAVVDRAEDAVEADNSSSSGFTSNASAASGGALKAGPIDPKLISFTQCADLKPARIIMGNRGEYTVQQGFSTKTQSGLINREPGEMTDGCILPHLGTDKLAYMEFDAAAYKAMPSSWEMQCVRSADPAAGTLPYTEGPYSVERAADSKQMMLQCGNSLGIEECADGNAGQRARVWEAKLKEQGLISLAAYTNTHHLSPEAGEKIYCQWYNKSTAKSLFAFEYIRTR